MLTLLFPHHTAEAVMYTLKTNLVCYEPPGAITPQQHRTSLTFWRITTTQKKTAAANPFRFNYFLKAFYSS